MEQYYFFWRMENTAHELADCLQQTDDTTVLDIPGPITTPHSTDMRLYGAMKETKTYPAAGPMRIVKALASGELAEIVLRVDRVLAPGRETTVKRSIVAVWNTKLPENIPVWLSDATADPAEIESIAGRPVANMTPTGCPKQQHEVLQVPSDVKLSTAASTPGPSTAKVMSWLALATRVPSASTMTTSTVTRSAPSAGIVLRSGVS